MTKYNEELRNKVYEQYVQGVPLSRIAREFKINRKTIQVWYNKYSWKERKEKVDTKATQKMDNTLAEIKADGIKIFRATMGKYVEGLKNDKVAIRPTDAVNVHKHLLHLYGEAETSVNVEVDMFKKLREAIDKKKKEEEEKEEDATEVCAKAKS